MSMIDTPPLTEAEQARVDSLLGAARRAYITGYIVAGVLLVLSALGNGPDIVLPIGDITVPSVPAAILGYGLVVIMTGVGDWFMWTAVPFLSSDPRRPPFAWISFSGRFPSVGPWFVSLLLPVLFAALACGSLLSAAAVDLKVWKLSVGSLVMGGLMLCYLPSFAIRYRAMIAEREDWHGTPLSLSIWLHFWMRLVRQVAISIAWFLPIFSVLEPWRAFVQDGSKLLWSCGLGVWAACFCAMPFSGKLDRYGVKHGFAAGYKPDGEP